MNLAVGFPCPTCGHEEANLLGFEKGRNADIVGFRFLCARCESVFRESRLTNEDQPAAVPARTGRGTLTG